MTKRLLAVTGLVVALAGNPSCGADSEKRSGLGSLIFGVKLACAAPAIAKAAADCEWSSIPRKLHEEQSAQREREKAAHHRWVQRITGLLND
jgi:hypothetical protein